MSQKLADPAIAFAVLMPHAPVLVPSLAREGINAIARSVAAIREGAQRLVLTHPDTIVLVSPHSPRRPHAFGIWNGERLCGTLAAFGLPSTSVDLPADRHLADAIVCEASARGIETWKIQQPELDHGAVVPLWFISEAGWNGGTVVVSLKYPGQPGVSNFGSAIASAAAACGVRVALVASGDMSHRLTPCAPESYEPRAMEFDHWLIDTLHRGDYRALPEFDAALEQLAGEDALDSVLLAAGATGFNPTGHEVLSYEDPFGVGYGVAILHDTATAFGRLTPNKENPWVHH